MAANTNPIFGRAPDVQVGTQVAGAANLTTTAVTAQDGSGSLQPIFQADATEGSYVDRVILKPVGSPAATVLRIFFCSATGAFTPGTTNTTTNTAMLAEYTAATVTTSNTQAQNDIVIPIRMPMPPGTRLLLGSGTSTGASGNTYTAITVGTKY